MGGSRHTAMKRILILLLLVSCTDAIEIQRGEDFTLTAGQYRTSISKGETREIPFNITTESQYSETVYTVRYFQAEGEGVLCTDDGRTMRENREHLLSDKEFSLFYTAATDSEHSFTVTVSDNLGHSHKVSIELAKK